MSQVKTYTGADVSLFHIAAKEYGDPLAWNRIAAANGMSDPMIRGMMDLIIPSPDRTTPTGVPDL